VVVSFAMNRRTLLDEDAVGEAMEYLVPDVPLGELGAKFMAVATDLATGEEVHLVDGGLHQVLRASGAIPGLLPAVEIDGRTLVDGGVVAEVPLAAARRLGRRVLAVDVSMELPPLDEDRLVLDTIMRTQMMSARLLRSHQLRRCGSIIRPAVGATTWAEWDKLDDMVAAGRAAAEEFFALGGS
jgi:NTE family protein